MKTLEMTQATGELASYAAQVREEPVVVTDHGKPVMALMSIENADLETVSLSTDPRFIALIERSRALYKPGTGIPLKGMPVAAHHDKFLGQDQYAHLKGYLRNAMSAPSWSGLSRDEKLERFIEECKRSRPDFQDLWQDMDRIPHVWSNAFEYCTEAIEREAGVRHG